MRTIHLAPEAFNGEIPDTLVITEPASADALQDRHFHFVFPAPVCAGIETLLVSFDAACTVSFEPGSVSFPELSVVAAQTVSAAAFERLLEVIDAPVLAEIGLIGFPGIPQALFQKTTLKKIELNGGAGVPTSIPDDIRNLVNLKYFKLFDSEVSYLSPEIFRLPRMREISFYRLRYEPTPEVMAAAEAFVAAGGSLDQPYGKGPFRI